MAHIYVCISFLKLQNEFTKDVQVATISFTLLAIFRRQLRPLLVEMLFIVIRPRASKIKMDNDRICNITFFRCLPLGIFILNYILQFY